MANKSISTDAGSIADLLATLIRLQNHLRLYGENNVNVEQTSARLFVILGQLFKRSDLVTLYVARHGFIYENTFIERTNRTFETFANSLFQHGIASLTLHSGVLPRAIYGFLALVSREPSQTWDEGGMANCLYLRNIDHLDIREMDEQVFRLVDEISEKESTTQSKKSALWERLAMSIVHEQQFSSSDASLMQELLPSALAELTNRELQGATVENRNALARKLSRFLISLKHEKIRMYRMEAVKKLAEYVNGLSPELRNLFLSNAFNLNLDADLSEGFTSGLTDEIIMDALQSAAKGSSYTPPIILKLLGRLAEERGITDKDATKGAINNLENSAKLKTLFKSDDFDAYVPKQYQDALLNIVKSDSLPKRFSEHLEKLKSTLEPTVMEQHIGDILLEILRGNSDQIHIDVIRDSLITVLDSCLHSGNYKKIIEIYGLYGSRLTDGESSSRLADYFLAEEFTSTLFTDLARADKEKAADIMEVILCLGSYVVDSLLDRLCEESDRSARRSCLNILSRLGAECKAKAIFRLADSRWFVTRNLLYLLREFNDPALLPHIRRYLDHPHPKVQQEALKTCMYFEDGKAIPTLLKALENKNESALISAISLASSTGDTRVTERLLSLLKEGSLMNYHLEIKKAAARALAVANPKLALPVFTELLTSRSLFQSHQLESLKLEIIALMENYPAESSCSVLQELVESGSPEIVRGARAALFRITGKK